MFRFKIVQIFFWYVFIKKFNAFLFEMCEFKNCSNQKIFFTFKFVEIREVFIYFLKMEFQKMFIFENRSNSEIVQIQKLFDF